MTIGIEDLPKFITGLIVREHETILCDKCNGIGTYTTEEMVDYHKREYETIRHSCSKCKGDGRLIVTKEYLKIDRWPDKTQVMPYVDFHDIVEPHKRESRWFKTRLDLTDHRLESKYPELAAVSYDKYDELVKKCELMEMLKKESA